MVKSEDMIIGVNRRNRKSAECTSSDTAFAWIRGLKRHKERLTEKQETL
jgi:hypothetical protein